MLDRVQGTTLPGYIATITDDTGTVISDGLNYTWIVEASKRSDRTLLWTKSTGITPSATGFTVVWANADIGSLSGVSSIPGVFGVAYVIEFTGTRGDGLILKHQEIVTVYQQVA